MTSVSEESGESDLPIDSNPCSSETLVTDQSAFLAGFEKLPELPWSRNWGLIQVALGVLTVFSSVILGVALGSFFAGPEALEEYRTGDAAPGVIAVCVLAVFQLSMFLWPFVVSAVWKGRGVVKDWGLKFKSADLLTGLAAALVALVVVPLLARLMSLIVGLEDQSEAGNTEFLREAEGSPWLYALIFGAAVGAPVAEEVFFRGFVQRSLERFSGQRVGVFVQRSLERVGGQIAGARSSAVGAPVTEEVFSRGFVQGSLGRFGGFVQGSLERFGGQIIGVLGSTVLFALPHFTGASLKPTIVLLVSISFVGLLFGTMAAVTRRLGPSIVAHLVFNSTVVALTVLG